MEDPACWLIEECGLGWNWEQIEIASRVPEGPAKSFLLRDLRSSNNASTKSFDWLFGLNCASSQAGQSPQ